jgi:hypothetical protein
MIKKRKIFEAPVCFRSRVVTSVEPTIEGQRHLIAFNDDVSNLLSRQTSAP